MRTELFIDVEVPNWLNERAHHRALNRRKQAQQDHVALMLRSKLARPELPCRVQLVRVTAGRPDDDARVIAMKYIRDAVARWVHRLEETIPYLKGGRLQFTKARKVKMTRPHAPDGPDDGITWEYPAGERGELMPRAPGQSRRRRRTGVKIILWH